MNIYFASQLSIIDTIFSACLEIQNEVNVTAPWRAVKLLQRVGQTLLGEQSSLLRVSFSQIGNLLEEL